jgi:hypothetical protein
MTDGLLEAPLSAQDAGEVIVGARHAGIDLKGMLVEDGGPEERGSQSEPEVFELPTCARLCSV